MNRFLILGVIVLGVLTRLIPQPPNFTPILSFALLSSVYSKNNLGILIPISIMVISDFYLGTHGAMVWVYSALFIIYLIVFDETFQRDLCDLLMFYGKLVFVPNFKVIPDLIMIHCFGLPC